MSNGNNRYKQFQNIKFSATESCFWLLNWKLNSQNLSTKYLNFRTDKWDTVNRERLAVLKIGGLQNEKKLAEINPQSTGILSYKRVFSIWNYQNALG